MKRHLLLASAAFLLTAATAHAQFNYNFAVSSQAYVPLTGATSLNGSLIWDDESFVAPLGFNFKINGITVNRLNLVSANLVGQDTSQTVPINGFAFTDVDIADRGTLTGTASKSPIRYLVSGTTPNRIFKTELFNAGFADEYYNYSTMSDSANIQIWLYETTNVVELRYGPSLVTHGADYYNFGTGPLVGYIDNLDPNTSTGKIYSMAGNPAAPTLDSFIIPFSFGATLTSWPSNGTVFRFTPKSNTPNSVSQITGTIPVTIYPTATAGTLHAAYSAQEHASYEILSIQGTAARRGSLLPGTQLIDVSSLPAGIYTLQVQNSKERGIFKFVKL